MTSLTDIPHPQRKKFFFESNPLDWPRFLRLSPSR